MKILITKSGGIEMLHDDEVNLGSFGHVETQRASHVEFCNVKQKWYVQSAKTLQILDWFDSRKEALEWEKTYYSPSGEGWKELHEGETI